MDLGYVLSLTGQTRKVKDLAKNEIGGKMSELGNGSKRIQLKWVFFTGQIGSVCPQTFFCPFLINKLK